MSLIKQEPRTLSSLQALNILSRYLPAHRPIFSQLTSIHPRKIMQTFNGKLIAEEISEFDKLQQKIEHLTQQFEQLELQMKTTTEKAQTDSSQQMVSLQKSLQKLERIYSCLLSTTVVTAIGLSSYLVWLGFNPTTTQTKLADQSVAISSLKTGVSR
jgi:TolA-binding protein